MNSTNFTRIAYTLLREHYRRANAVCGPPTPPPLSPAVAGLRFWVSGAAISAVGGAGLIGNLLSFMTIITMKKRNLFNNLLLTLTIFDTIFLVNGGAFFLQEAFKFDSYLFNLLFPKVIYPLAGFSMTGRKEFIVACTYCTQYTSRRINYAPIAITEDVFPRQMEAKREARRNWKSSRFDIICERSVLLSYALQLVVLSWICSYTTWIHPSVNNRPASFLPRVR